MTEAEQFATLAHELALEMIHRKEKRNLITRTVRETEAEAVAFVVCHAMGLETGTASSDYIHLYHGNAELLAESLEVVQNTAAVILGALRPEPAVSVTPAWPDHRSSARHHSTSWSAPRPSRPKQGRAKPTCVPPVPTSAGRRPA